MQCQSSSRSDLLRKLSTRIGSFSSGSSSNSTRYLEDADIESIEREIIKLKLKCANEQTENDIHNMETKRLKKSYEYYSKRRRSLKEDIRNVEKKMQDQITVIQHGLSFVENSHIERLQMKNNIDFLIKDIYRKESEWEEIEEEVRESREEYTKLLRSSNLTLSYNDEAESELEVFFHDNDDDKEEVENESQCVSEISRQSLKRDGSFLRRVMLNAQHSSRKTFECWTKSGRDWLNKQQELQEEDICLKSGPRTSCCSAASSGSQQNSVGGIAA